jgi:epoxyqueuosine reductase
MTSSLKQSIFAYARSLGFSLVGITTAEPFPEGDAALTAWLDDGCAGDMEYMKRAPSARSHPRELLPGARSIIALAMSYYSDDRVTTGPSNYSNTSNYRTEQRQFRGPSSALSLLGPDSSPHGRIAPFPVDEGSGTTRPVTHGRVARYAWGKDYHRVMRKRLESLVRYIESLAPEAKCRITVDTSPLLERATAQRAGLGFVGKNTMLVTRGFGSWVFLASVVTTLDLPADPPDRRSCGLCRICIDSCPAQAITAPYRLDARRCTAYWTIESREPVPEPLKGKTGNWIFGCDACQEACPHNKRAASTNVPEFNPSRGAGARLPLREVLALKTDEEFKKRFGGTPLARLGRERLIRNARQAALNFGFR